MKGSPGSRPRRPNARNLSPTKSHFSSIKTVNRSSASAILLRARRLHHCNRLLPSGWLYLGVREGRKADVVGSSFSMDPSEWANPAGNECLSSLRYPTMCQRRASLSWHGCGQRRRYGEERSAISKNGVLPRSQRLGRPSVRRARVPHLSS